MILLGFIALTVIVLPVAALGTRVPWGELGQIAAATETRELLGVTLTSAVLATAISVLLGTPLALLLQRMRRGAHLARALVLLPLAMPPVVAGLALSAFIGRRGIAAPLLDAVGAHFAFAFPGVVAAHVYVALPFVVITLDSALRQLDPEITNSAAAVGIGERTIISRIVLPAIAPSLATAAGLAFARSLGEFGTTLTFAGSMPGVTRTMPLGIYLAREIDQDVAYGLAAILITLAVAALALAALPRLFRRPAPTPRVRATGVIDVARLRELTRPRATGAVAGFPTGATTALIGPNGAGKTTLLRSLAGPGVVLLTQNPGLPPTSTPLKAIAMVTQDSAAARELLAAAGLRELAHVPVPSLSGGQAAQVALVRALAAKPSSLLLDEPLAAIDAAAAGSWRELLRAASGDRTTVFVTHSGAELFQLADHVAVMERGEVVSLAPADAERDLPATAFSAQLQGLARVEGTAQAATAAGGEAIIESEAGQLRGHAAAALAPGQAAVAVYDLADPENVRIHPAR